MAITIDGIVIDDAERTECEVWTRVMGYFRPVTDFNIGKKQEFKERIAFRFNVAMNRMEVVKPINTQEESEKEILKNG